MQRENNKFFLLLKIMNLARLLNYSFPVLFIMDTIWQQLICFLP